MSTSDDITDEWVTLQCIKIAAGYLPDDESKMYQAYLKGPEVKDWLSFNICVRGFVNNMTIQERRAYLKENCEKLRKRFDDLIKLV